MLNGKASLKKQKRMTFFLVYLLSFIPLNYFINVFLTEYLNFGFGISAFAYGLAVCFGVFTYSLCFKKNVLFGCFLILLLISGTIAYLVFYPTNTAFVFTSLLDFAYNPFIIPNTAIDKINHKCPFW